MDITDIVSAVITLIAALITTFVIPWLKTKLDADKLANLTAWAKIAVSAAEQIYAGVGRGAEKKAYVTKFLGKHGYTVNADEIDGVIEAAVAQLKLK